MAPNRPQGGLLGPARVGRSGQRVTAQPAPPGAVIRRKSFVGVVVLRFLGGGLTGSGGPLMDRSRVPCGAARVRPAGLRKGRIMRLHRRAVRGCAGA